MCDSHIIVKPVFYINYEFQSGISVHFLLWNDNERHSKAKIEIMVSLSGMYENPSVNNKVQRLFNFNLKMAEGTLVAEHLNDLGSITN